MQNSDSPKPVSRLSHYALCVEFGDCDPAGIVWFPNFYRWIDASSRHFFVNAGIASWRDTEAAHGIIGTPLVDSKASFRRPATYGDELVVESCVLEWRNKSFVMRHRILNAGGELVMECEEVRVFAVRRSDTEGGIKAVAAPESIRLACAAPAGD